MLRANLVLFDVRELVFLVAGFWTGGWSELILLSCDVRVLDFVRVGPGVGLS